MLRGLIDIGANLTDPMFRGVYHGIRKHPDDFLDVLERAWNIGMGKIIVTSGCLKEVNESLNLISSDDRLYTTVGCHPTRCSDFEKHGAETYLQNLHSSIENNKNKVVAVGEFGLDYDRLQFCPKETQLKYFEIQFDLLEAFRLPAFLHCRNAFSDLVNVVNRNREKMNGGVIHSFTGTVEEAKTFLDMGFYIGINGCSLKTEDNLEAVRSIPLDRILVESDAPWCEIKPTHSGYSYIKTRFGEKKKEKYEKGYCIKGRNEPSKIIQVLEILAEVRGEDLENLSEQISKNTVDLFNFF